MAKHGFTKWQSSRTYYAFIILFILGALYLSSAILHLPFNLLVFAVIALYVLFFFATGYRSIKIKSTKTQ